MNGREFHSGISWGKRGIGMEPKNISAFSSAKTSAIYLALVVVFCLSFFSFPGAKSFAQNPAPPYIAEFVATPTAAAPGELVILSWHTSGGQPYHYRVDAGGQPLPVTSDALALTGSLAVPIDASTGNSATFVLGLLSVQTGQWLDTETLQVRVNPASPGLADPYEPPSFQPSPQSQAKMGPFTFSSGFDETSGQPSGVGQVFPVGTLMVWVSWPYSGFQPETPYTFDWYRDGQLFEQGQNRFWKASGVTWEWVIGANHSNLLPGVYSFVLYVNGQRFDAGSVTIGGGYQPPPPVQPVPGAYTVFFSIDANGRPWGYVFDKSGVRHDPPPGILTIGGPQLKPAPGDRIYIRTDASRFSFLFDCGTSPDSYSPCDVMADSQANMPSEIVTNFGDRLGMLNISGPDNWAGDRPNFPGQRYPADPVLRIAFGSNW